MDGSIGTALGSDPGSCVPEGRARQDASGRRLPIACAFATAGTRAKSSPAEVVRGNGGAGGWPRAAQDVHKAWYASGRTPQSYAVWKCGRATASRTGVVQDRPCLLPSVPVVAGPRASFASSSPMQESTAWSTRRNQQAPLSPSAPPRGGCCEVMTIDGIEAWQTTRTVQIARRLQTRPTARSARRWRAPGVFSHRPAVDGRPPQHGILSLAG